MALRKVVQRKLEQNSVCYGSFLHSYTLSKIVYLQSDYICMTLSVLQFFTYVQGLKFE